MKTSHECQNAIHHARQRALERLSDLLSPAADAMYRSGSTASRERAVALCGGALVTLSLSKHLGIDTRIQSDRELSPEDLIELEERIRRLVPEIVRSETAELTKQNFAATQLVEAFDKVCPCETVKGGAA